MSADPDELQRVGRPDQAAEARDRDAAPAVGAVEADARLLDVVDVDVEVAVGGAEAAVQVQARAGELGRRKAT